MTDIRDAEPCPPDDSGGYCFVSAGMHMEHDDDCPGYPIECPTCAGTGANPLSDNTNWLPCQTCRGLGTVAALAAAP